MGRRKKMLFMKINNVIIQFEKRKIYTNKYRKRCSMDAGCNNRMHFHIMMHKDGNKISVITYCNSKPEYYSVGDYVWVKKDYDG